MSDAHLSASAIALLCVSCAGPIVRTSHDAAESATQGAIAAVHVDTTQLEADSARIASAAVTGAIASVDAPLKKLVADAVASANAPLRGLIAGADAQLSVDTQALTKALSERLRESLRLTIDEALGPATLVKADALRETALGAPLRGDVDALIDAAAPHLAQAMRASVEGALAPLQADAARARADVAADIAKWRWLAIGLAVCTTVAIVVIHQHRRRIVELEARS